MTKPLKKVVTKQRKEGQMSKVGLVIAREYSTRVKKRSFFVLTLLIPILMALVGIAAIWFTIEKEKHYKVLISDPENITESKIFVSHDDSDPPATFYFTEQELGPDDYSREDLKDFDIFIGVGRNTFTNKTIKGIYREEPSKYARNYILDKLETRLEEYWAVDHGIPLQTYREIDQNFKFDLHDVEDVGLSEGELSKKDTREEKTKKQGVGFGFSILIFVFLMVYAGQVMRGVLEEKTSRVVEIVVSSVKPFELMMGKIIAIGLVGLTQFLMWVVLLTIIMAGVQALFISDLDPETLQALGDMQMNPGESGKISESESTAAILFFQEIKWGILIPLFFVYFIGGYLLYASIFAIVGAAADSETDTQQLIIPVMIPLMFVYIVSISILGSPDSSAAIIGSYVPFSSPIIMLQRVAAGTVAFWEVILSLLILIGTFVLTTYLAGKVYRTGILMYGKKASWKEIIKWLRH
ncbi:MAG: ABC transporter permease [Crocinitomicaceae bacterium]|nr:ABC transporter permease [Crocinitomicaceae bacterium]